eukprot:TRINITY_DN2803_c0_g1_i1.p1 TRINITY_DN2803_c0_g1~~TRINITY_DN2803_c0_g1_i1.p1  ORF type:complete len:428 (+),score=83.45 TRINITY_DN2803_c0_g1_i1:150-1433(+)
MAFLYVASWLLFLLLCGSLASCEDTRELHARQLGLPSLSSAHQRRGDCLRSAPGASSSDRWSFCLDEGSHTVNGHNSGSSPLLDSVDHASSSIASRERYEVFSVQDYVSAGDLHKGRPLTWALWQQQQEEKQEQQQQEEQEQRQEQQQHQQQKDRQQQQLQEKELKEEQECEEDRGANSRAGSQQDQQQGQVAHGHRGFAREGQRYSLQTLDKALKLSLQEEQELEVPGFGATLSRPSEAGATTIADRESDSRQEEKSEKNLSRLETDAKGLVDEDIGAQTGLQANGRVGSAETQQTKHTLHFLQSTALSSNLRLSEGARQPWNKGNGSSGESLRHWGNGERETAAFTPRPIAIDPARPTQSSEPFWEQETRNETLNPLSLSNDASVSFFLCFLLIFCVLFGAGRIYCNRTGSKSSGFPLSVAPMPK